MSRQVDKHNQSLDDFHPKGQFQVNQLVDHLFRHEAGKIIAGLTRYFGPDNLELVEDAVQEALLKAAQQWPFRGIPENPAIWLRQVAKNKAIDFLRREKTLSDKLLAIIQDFDRQIDLATPRFDHEVQDDLLRMIFTCCHPAIPQESQVALTLKTLCGFSVAEIAGAFLIKEETMARRLVRARQKIREMEIPFEVPVGTELSERLEAVLDVSYLLFNEGYKASQGEALIRWDLCREAVRLTTLLAEHPVSSTPETHALLALMLLHSARLGARQDEQGELLLLSEQDRAAWDQALICKGLVYLNKSTESKKISEYHLQAGIAALHCLAESYEATNWPRILALYDLLLEINNSPVIALNRAVALAEVHGPKAGIEAINDIEDSKAVIAYYPFYVTRAELYMRLGAYDKACLDYQQALALADVKAEQAFLLTKLEDCQEKLS